MPFGSYGDLYTDDGQYMEKKSPYYDAIDALLRARIKYVAGGQDMKVTYMGVSREADKCVVGASGVPRLHSRTPVPEGAGALRGAGSGR